MIVNNSSYSAKIDSPKPYVNDNPVQQKKSEQGSNKVSIPAWNPVRTVLYVTVMMGAGLRIEGATCFLQDKTLSEDEARTIKEMIDGVTRV